jgi:hypothetical protein
MERFVHFRCDFQPRVNRPSSIGLPGEAEILNAVGIENKSGDAAGCVAGEGDFADVAHEDIGQGRGARNGFMSFLLAQVKESSIGTR